MKLIALLLFSILLSGCVTREITFPNGAKYKSVSFLTNPNIGAVKMTGGREHIDFSLGGYSHEQQEAMRMLLATLLTSKP